MSLNELTAISAVDGRYRSKTENLHGYFSEAALLKYRLVVEARWLLFLSKKVASANLSLGPDVLKVVERFASPETISEGDLARVKDIEKTTNHDVKACEYLLRESLQKVNAPERVLAFIHFCCTSEDINNTAYALMCRDGLKDVILPEMALVIDDLQKKAIEHKDLPMLARTHGQTASPTTLGKEIGVFAHRLYRVFDSLSKHEFEGKFNGAVGNYNAHAYTLPNEDWPTLARRFIEDYLGLRFNPLTTQIENHDSIGEMVDELRRFQSIAIGLCRDIWTYVSLGYFKQRVIAGEVGSSTMPHKVNPIDFENAEGNFGLSNSLAVHLGEKLLISRLQRDLSDSTVLRSLGTMAGHSQIALKSLQKGLSKITVNELRLEEDLNGAWEVLAEPVQSVLRAGGVVDAYERLKELTRGQAIDEKSYQDILNQLEDLSSQEKDRLRELKPRNYVGVAAKVVQETLAAEIVTKGS